MVGDRLTIGFIPLCDAAPLVVAKEEGFFEELDLDVTLVKGNSWAHIRDQLAFGDLDAAHMLSPMVVASALGLTPMRVSFATAFGLN
ncbi:MAG: ABC transporter substrate-binding protein, partial [Pseudomonadota bacterium]